MVALAAHDFGQVVDEDMGDVVVAGVQAADEAFQGGIAGDVIIAGLHQV